MELSENTLQILRNFSGINQNLLIKSGSNIKTISEARNVVATADVTENFEKDFGIYDLNEFIGVMGLVNTPSLKFEDDFVTVSDASGRSKVKYFYAAEETLTSPAKDVNMPDGDVKFTLDNDTLNKLKKAASTLGHNEVSIKANNGVLSLSIVENQNATSNAFSIDIDGEFKQDAVFNFIISISNLKILPGDYDVEISSKLITQFKHKEIPLKYWIALEKTSTYGA
ncbi:MAG: hypothetical protein HKN86_00095 [Acidimicrobiia bacterium]|nr:hypothetical protein [Acidimicrobiia bacterium]